MNKKLQIFLLAIFSSLCIIGFWISPVLTAPVLREAREETTTGSGKYKSRIDMQGDAVYEDESGYTSFVMWVNGKNGYNVLAISTRILVYIYYTAYYQYYYTYPNPYYDYAWETPPEDLFEWTGDWDYNHDHLHS